MILKIRQENVDLRYEIRKDLGEIQQKLTQKDQHISDLTRSLACKSDELSDATKEIVSLRGAIAELNSQLSVNAWKNFRSQSKEKPTLVVGSSIIRDIAESNIENTDLICISGGRVRDAIDAVSKTPSDKYDRAVLCIGGNDCDPRDLSTKEEPSVIVDRYEELIKLCKQKANSVTVSSVCPRISDNRDVMARIDSVNAGLQVLNGQENATFVDNTTSFHLKNNSINDAYYLVDGTHLTYKGTNKLAQNLNLNIKNGVKSVCDKRKKHERKPYPEPPTRSDWSTTRHTANYDVPTRTIRAPNANKGHSRQQFKNQTTSQDTNYREGGYNRYSTGTRCYYCYEQNHTKKACRHEKPIVCNTCGTEGHKSKHH